MKYLYFDWVNKKLINKINFKNTNSGTVQNQSSYYSNIMKDDNNLVYILRELNQSIDFKLGEFKKWFNNNNCNNSEQTFLWGTL